MPPAVNQHVDADRSIHWIAHLRSATNSSPTFMLFPHAGGSSLSAGRLASALPSDCGLMVANLPRGGGLDEDAPPRRVSDALQGLEQGFLALSQTSAPAVAGSLVLVGNSYGALLAYEMAWRLARRHIPVSRLVVSGFRSPVLPCLDAPLYRLPWQQLRTELAARFGTMPGMADWATDLVEPGLRADLEACDTYRHTHVDRLSVPITVLHMCADVSVSLDELRAWKAVTNAPTLVRDCAMGHFPWATHPDIIADILFQLAYTSGGSQAAFFPPATKTINDKRGRM